MTSTVTIPLDDYMHLLKRQKFLQALIDCGVEKWDGYGRAYRRAHPEDFYDKIENKGR